MRKLPACPVNYCGLYGNTLVGLLISLNLFSMGKFSRRIPTSYVYYLKIS